MGTKDINAELNPSCDLSQEEQLFIKTWAPLLNHPVWTLPTQEARKSFIQSHVKTLEKEVTEGKLSRVRVEKSGRLLLSVLLATEDDISPSLRLRVLLIANELSEENAVNAWEKALTVIQQLCPHAKQLELTLTKGPSEHADQLKTFGFINTKQAPEPPLATSNFDPDHLERWNFSLS